MSGSLVELVAKGACTDDIQVTSKTPCKSGCKDLNYCEDKQIVKFKFIYFSNPH